MAKDQAKGETVEIPVEVLRQLQARLDVLEQRDRVAAEQLLNPRANVLDKEFEAWKEEAGRPANVRTQAAADRMFQGPQRFMVGLDSTDESGKVMASEHFPLTIAANSDLEAQARYQSIMGITRHEYRIKVEPVAA